MDGKILKPGTQRTREDLAHHVLANVVVDSNGCWIWQRAIASHGYGHLTAYVLAPGKYVTAHYVSYRLFVGGDVPKGFHLHHVCGVRPCCNPYHLKLVDPFEHKREHNGDTCRHGHDPSNWRKNNKGHRYCRECYIIRKRKKRESVRRNSVESRAVIAG